VRTPIRVLVANDHPSTRADLRTALEQDERFVVCADVADAAAAVQAAVRERPDLCLLDIRMSGSGIAATREITSRLPETKVVIFTVSRDDRDLFDALRAGAVGYLLKETDPARLPHALYDVLDGEAAIPRRLVARLVTEFREHGPRRRAVLNKAGGYDLTSREWEVLDLLRQGQSTAEIAELLFVSRVTVRSHIAAILKKLRVSDRASLRRLDEG